MVGMPPWVVYLGYTMVGMPPWVVYIRVYHGGYASLGVYVQGVPWGYASLGVYIQGVPWGMPPWVCITVCTMVYTSLGVYNSAQSGAFLPFHCWSTVPASSTIPVSLLVNSSRSRPYSLPVSLLADSFCSRHTFPFHCWSTLSPRHHPFHCWSVPRSLAA